MSKFCPFSPRNLTGKQQNSKIRISYVFSNFEQVGEYSRNIHIPKIFKKVSARAHLIPQRFSYFCVGYCRIKMSMSTAA